MLVLLSALVSVAGFGFRDEKSLFRKKVVGRNFRAGLYGQFSLSLLVLSERRAAMPAKLTFAEVKKTFSEAGCVLLAKSYQRGD